MNERTIRKRMDFSHWMMFTPVREDGVLTKAYMIAHNWDDPFEENVQYDPKDSFIVWQRYRSIDRITDWLDKHVLCHCDNTSAHIRRCNDCTKYQAWIAPNMKDRHRKIGEYDTLLQAQWECEKLIRYY